ASERCTLNSSLFHVGIQPHSPAAAIAPVMEETYDGVGRCKCAFWLAVVHDVLGVLVIMVGVFGGLVIHDVFIYGGAIVIFLSLIWWIFWYSGNIDVPPEELEDDVGLMKTRNRRLSQAVRRVSNGIRNSFRKKAQPVEEGPSGGPGPSDCGTDVTLSTIYAPAALFCGSEHLGSVRSDSAAGK
uniref:Si:dkey-16i5.8 n=1 Tax=Xiphophorus maculatus TaxID=8083 RepID=A0A3B5PSZ8_XIPMA